MDRVTGGRDTKHGAGAVGILTAGLVDRQRAYEALVTYALAPFLSPAYYDGETLVMGAPFVVHEYVRWGDVDIVGIIRYDAYLRFFEYAESELLRAVGLLYHDMVARYAVTLPRKVMHAEFMTPARLDERLTIHTYVSAIGRTSLTLNFDMFADDGTPRAKGYLVVVAVDVSSLEKQPLPAGADRTARAVHRRLTTTRRRPDQSAGGASSASSRY